MKLVVCSLLYAITAVFSQDNYTMENSTTPEVSRRAMIPHVVNGLKVPIKMFPHSALLYQDMQPFCGGSIITTRSVLTAAHCTMDDSMTRYRSTKGFFVQLGSDQITYDYWTAYKVCSIFKHPKYDIGSYMYDLGIILLDRTIKFSPTVRKIEIATNYHWRNQLSTFYVSGYGLTEKGDFSTSLKATRMRYIPSVQCMKAQEAAMEEIVAYMPVPKSMFCMIGDEFNSDCSGDSGSAIVWGNYQVGTVTTGIAYDCGSPSMPSMYTDVVFFRNFIYHNAERMEKSNPVSKCSYLYRKLKGNKKKKQNHKIYTKYYKKRKQNGVVIKKGHSYKHQTVPWNSQRFSKWR